MPNIKSAKKRVKVTLAKTAQNKAYKSALRTAVKSANAAVSSNAVDKVSTVNLAFKKLDQACSKGILHKNAASRKKSALMRRLNNISQ